MPLTFEEIDDWTRKTGTLEALQDELSQRATTLSGLQDQLADIRSSMAEGRRARPRQSFDPVENDVAKAAAAVGAVRAQVGETIADLTELNGKISEAKQFASANGYAIQFNGNIVDLWDLDDKANASPAELQRHEEARGRLMDMVTEIVGRGNEIESEASRVLWAANRGESAPKASRMPTRPPPRALISRSNPTPIRKKSRTGGTGSVRAAAMDNRKSAGLGA